MTSSSSVTAASSRPTAPRASSASGCWRCCWPSARCIAARRDAAPVMLLDDVMSELDAGRRAALVELLHADGGPGGHHRHRSRAHSVGRRRRHHAHRGGGRVTCASSPPAPRTDEHGAAPTLTPIAQPRPGPPGGRGLAPDACSPRCRRPGRPRSARWSRQEARPVSERAGTLTVACSAAVWAQELELISEHIIVRLNVGLTTGPDQRPQMRDGYRLSGPVFSARLQANSERPQGGSSGGPVVLLL